LEEPFRFIAKVDILDLKIDALVEHKSSCPDDIWTDVEGN
jgi:hypothetical protein